MPASRVTYSTMRWACLLAQKYCVRRDKRPWLLQDLTIMPFCGLPIRARAGYSSSALLDVDFDLNDRIATDLRKWIHQPWEPSGSDIRAARTRPSFPKHIHIHHPPHIATVVDKCGRFPDDTRRAENRCRSDELLPTSPKGLLKPCR